MDLRDSAEYLAVAEMLFPELLVPGQQGKSAVTSPACQNESQMIPSWS